MSRSPSHRTPRGICGWNSSFPSVCQSKWCCITLSDSPSVRPVVMSEPVRKFSGWTLSPAGIWGGSIAPSVFILHFPPPLHLFLSLSLTPFFLISPCCFPVTWPLFLLSSSPLLFTLTLIFSSISGSFLPLRHYFLYFSCLFFLKICLLLSIWPLSFWFSPPSTSPFRLPLSSLL